MPQSDVCHAHPETVAALGEKRDLIIPKPFNIRAVRRARLVALGGGSGASAQLRGTCGGGIQSAGPAAAASSRPWTA